MSKVSRIALVFGFFLLILAIAVSSAPAQRRSSFNPGGNNQNNNNQNNNQNNNNSNKNKDKDDDDDSNSNRGNKNSQSNNQQNNNQNNNQNVQQLQDLLKKGQSNNSNNNNNNNNNGNSNNRNRNRNDNNQGQYQNSQQFPGNKNYNQNHNGQQGGLQIGNVQFGDWQKKNWQGSHKVEHWNKQYNNGPQFFSSQWYDSHPNAWRYNHPHSDVWVVATVPGVYSWLGWGNNYPQGNVVYDNSQPFNPDAYGEWYPLGVYSMVTGPGDNGTRIVQLSVDRQGNVNGTYYDLVMDTSRQVSGRIRQSSQNVSWSLNSNPQLTFRAPLDQLMQPQGIVTVELPGGEQQWQLIRLQN